jgi:hypothetical protein
MSAMHSNVVYTAIFGDYDRLEPVNPSWNCDFVCFTDNPAIVAPGWRPIVVQLNGELPAAANRRYKMLPHKYLSSYVTSLYVDGHIKIIADPSDLFRKYLEFGSIALMKHPDRDCAYDEAVACIASGLVNKQDVQRQMSEYAAQGFPKKFGLTANGLIFRKHLDENVIDLMECWWQEYCIGGKRDQLSLQFLIWKRNIKAMLLEESAFSEMKHFRISIHKWKRRVSIMGRLVDYVACNRRRNYFFTKLHECLHKFNKNKILKVIAK